jgi:hypothetical protein
MYRGTIELRAGFIGNGIKFSYFEINPNETGVELVGLEGPNGREIRGTIRLTSLQTKEDGKAIAIKVLTAILDRLSFLHNLAIESAHIGECKFTLSNPPSGAGIVVDTGECVIVGEVPILAIGYPAETIKAELERPPSLQEHHFSFFRSARISRGSVEEFMHLYNLLLMVLGDYQPSVERFIMKEEPGTPQTPSKNPKAKPGEMESVYTRLRNEFGHRRQGVNPNDTKAEMATHVGRLAALTKRAIELHG